MSNIDARLARLQSLFVEHERLVADAQRFGTATEYSNALWESRERVYAAIVEDNKQ